MSFAILPSELLVKLFQPSPLQELCSLRLVCSGFREAIDTSPELQIQMVFEHMMAMQHKCNIPTGDLKYELRRYQLSVEVGDNLTLSKLLHTSLLRVLPWITRVIVKNAHPDEVKNLCLGLKDSRRLQAVYLVNCNGEIQFLPREKIVEVAPGNADEYTLPKILSSEEDLVALEIFCQRVEDDSIPAETVLKTMEEVSPLIRDDICASIWHSALMPLSGDLQPKESIQKQVEEFIAKEPHSAPIRAAADKSFREFKRNISF